MVKVGIFYGSSSGATARAADEISVELSRRGIRADVMNIAYVAPKTIDDYSRVILGTSTWGAGVLQDDWEDFLEHLAKVDFRHKKVALFGTGDQETYPDTFLDGMGILFERLTRLGASVAGKWSSDGYKFRESMGTEGREFVGLALDEETQPFHSTDRIKAWVDQLIDEFE